MRIMSLFNDFRDALFFVIIYRALIERIINFYGNNPLLLAME